MPNNNSEEMPEDESGNNQARNGARDVISKALEDTAPVNTMRHADPPPGTDRLIKGAKAAPGKWTANELGLPVDCPVVPLGYDNDLMFYLTPRGTLSMLSAGKSGKGHIKSLFAGRINYLFWAWPLYTANKQISVKKFDVDGVESALFDACAYKGAWNPSDKMRGRGASLNEFGQLVYHAGDIVYCGSFDNDQDPGEIGRYLYPKLDKGARPWGSPEITDMYNSTQQIYEAVLTWNWRRPDLDAKLAVAWMGCAMFGGALEWRPHMGLTGGRSTGKSTLHKLFELVMGRSLVKAADTTAAGIYQSLRHDTVAVLYDEAESSQDDRAVQAVIKLARISSSGGKALRGGAEHNHVEFVLRSCFMLSAINLPALAPQDRSRFTVLDLMPFEEPGNMPDFTNIPFGELGRKMLRRIMDNWKPFQQAFQAYRGALISGLDMDSRAGDQYGTLVAMWHILTEDGQPNTEHFKRWAKLLEPLVETELKDNVDNWQGCLEHLLDTPLDAWRTKTYKSIRALLYACFRPCAPADVEIDSHNVRSWLNDIGMSIEFKGGLISLDNAYLFVPSRHPVVAELYANSAWRTGAGSRGVWIGAFKQAPPEMLAVSTKAKVMGAVRSGIKIKVSGFLRFEDRPDQAGKGGG